MNSVGGGLELGTSIPGCIDLIRTNYWDVNFKKYIFNAQLEGLPKFLSV